MLDKVKIPEKQKSVDLCPVYLEPSDPKLPTWEYKGVKYRGSKPDAKEKFHEGPGQATPRPPRSSASSTTSCRR